MLGSCHVFTEAIFYVRIRPNQSEDGLKNKLTLAAIPSRSQQNGIRAYENLSLKISAPVIYYIYLSL